MLPKSKRLNLKVSFKWVASGNKSETPSLKLLFREGENIFPLVGIAMSSKTFNKASLRNRAKRLASAAIEEVYSTLKKNINLVIMPKYTCLEKKPEDLIRELKNVKNIFEIN